MIDMQLVEEKTIIYIKYFNAYTDIIVLIDSGARKSIMTSRWLEEYLRDGKVSNEDVKYGVVQEGLDWGKQYM